MNSLQDKFLNIINKATNNQKITTADFSSEEFDILEDVVFGFIYLIHYPADNNLKNVEKIRM